MTLQKLCCKIHVLTDFNPFHVTGLFLYPLKTSENQSFLVFSGGIEQTSDVKWANVFIAVCIFECGTFYHNFDNMSELHEPKF